MPRFSVIIPAYNAVGTVGQTIRSVLAQTEPDFELIVVDDGSADRTPATVAEIAAGDPRVTLIEQENQGTAGARNTGLARAGASYLSFLDNDDLWMPRYLEHMGAALDAEPRAGFAYCDAWGLNDRDLRLLRRTELESRPGPPPGADHTQQLLALARANFVMSSTTVRRDALEEAGGFDPAVRGTDDYDLWFRIMLAGRTAVLGSPTPLLLQRDRFDSQSKDELMMDRGLLLVLERVTEDPRTPEPVRAEAGRRARAVRREIELRGGSNPLPRAAFGLRERAIDARDRLLSKRKWLERPPVEVAQAFPEIAAAYERSSSSAAS